MKNLLGTFGFIFLSYLSYSQEASAGNDDKSSGKNSSIQINFSTAPTQSVSGTDTSYANSFSIAPLLDLRSKAGWGVSYSPAVITSGARTGIYMHTLSAGFERYGRNQTDLAFSYNHFIATNKTSVPYTPIANEIFFYISHTGSWIHPLVSTSFGFGKDSSAAGHTVTELGLQAGINHSFGWEEAGPFSSIDLTPGLVLNVGNDQYFSFLTVSKYKSHSSHLLKQTKKSSNDKKSGNSFSQIKFSNVELNTEMELEVGNFGLQPEGSIFIPIGSNDRTVYGYWQLGVHYRF